MKRFPLWAIFAVASLPPMAAFIQCSNSNSQAPPPPPPPPPAAINTVMKPADTVLRARLQPCNSSSDCKGAGVVPRCALDPVSDINCDTSDAGGQPIPDGKAGFCAFVIPIGDSRCNCFEGDIRYCDLNGWNTCTLESPGSCGIQMCLKGPQGQDPSSIPPGPGWGPCRPQVAPPTPVVDSGGGDAGGDAGD